MFKIVTLKCVVYKYQTGFYVHCRKEIFMTNFDIKHLGCLANLADKENGKVFLHDILNLSSCEVSINCVPKGFKLPFNHKHKQNEEIYLFLKGTGKMYLDGNGIDVKEGSCIKINPPVLRSFENTGDTDVQFICIQAKANSLEQFGLSDAKVC